MRTLKERLAELRQIDNPTPEDFTRLWQLAEDMDDEIDRLGDAVESANEYNHLTEDDL